MKANIAMFWIIAIFFAIVTATYIIWNLLHHQMLEWTGTLAIFGATLLAGFIAFYLGLVARKQGGVLIEDREDGDIDDGDPETGFFSPWSWWPILLAFAAAIMALGLSIGGYAFWLAFLSAPLYIIAVVGWIYEYYRGHFAR